jgi:hypothetical protein
MMHIDQIEKTVNCYYHLYGECAKGRLSVEDEACVYCLERALEDISFALRSNDFVPFCLYRPSNF